eukprot:g1436.t1
MPQERKLHYLILLGALSVDFGMKHLRLHSWGHGVPKTRNLSKKKMSSTKTIDREGGGNATSEGEPVGDFVKMPTETSSDRLKRKLGEYKRRTDEEIKELKEENAKFKVAASCKEAMRVDQMGELSFWWGFCTLLFCVALLWAMIASYYTYDGDGYYVANDPYVHPGRSTVYHSDGRPYTDDELAALRNDYYAYSGYGTDWALLTVTCLCLLFILPMFCIFTTVPVVLVNEREKAHVV